MLAFILAIVMVMGLSTTAFAAKKNALASLLDISQATLVNGPTDIVIVNSGSSNDKSAYFAAENHFLEDYAPNRAITRSILVNLNDYQTKDVKSSSVSAKLDTDITYGIISDLRANGISRITWLGSNPINCDEIKMEDTWTINGVGVGFEFGSGNSWTVTGSIVSSTATWSESYNDKWTISHDYSNLDFNGYELYIKQNVTGYFTFGTATYQVSAVDSTLL